MMEPQLSEGQYRVGLSLTPSKSQTVSDFHVDQVKSLTAELIDVISPIAADRYHPGARCASIAMTEFESAAMWAVKAITQQPR